MKVACDRCEKVVNYESAEYRTWRQGLSYVPRTITPGNKALLCDYCYDKYMDFLHFEEKTAVLKKS